MTQNTAPNPESTQFGTENVTPEEKTAKVRGVFDSVADQYDVMNDLMSGGVHRLWKNHLIRRIRPKAGLSYLDVAGGTGDIAFRIKEAIEKNSPPCPPVNGGGITLENLHVNGGDMNLQSSHLNGEGFSPLAKHKKTSPSLREGLGEGLQSSPNDKSKHPHLNPPPTGRGNERDNTSLLGRSSITLCDLNWDMLRVGRDRAVDRGYLDEFDWVTGNAESLPIPSNSVDVYTIAFGLRNVTRIDDGLKEAFRVLKPGGRFFCLEFSHVQNPVLSKLYDGFSFGVIPKIGEVVAKDRASYQYLVESIRKFPTQKALISRMEQAGFTKCRYENLSFGIAAIHYGIKI